MERVVRVEVAAGFAGQQVLVPLALVEGSTVEQAIAAAGLDVRLPELTVDPGRVGIFGTRVPPDRVLADGDRVEVYRPLKADPREVRRQLAELERDRKTRS